MSPDKIREAVVAAKVGLIEEMLAASPRFLSPPRPTSPRTLAWIKLHPERVDRAL